MESLRALPDRLLAKLPPEERADPQVRAEVEHLALEALTSSALAALNGDGDHPAFVAQIGQVLDVGQPNADTVYRVAEITPGGVYRLRGRKGSLRLVMLGEIGRKAGPMGGYYDLNALHQDADGRFDVVLSPTRPAGYTGDWWALDPGAAGLLLRMVSGDWSREVDPTISIERLDRPVTRPRPSAADLEARLRRLPAATSFIAGLFVAHVSDLRAQGYVNRLKAADFSKMGGLKGQFYYEGAYELKDDEALIVEVTPPSRCLYRSLILTNELYETTDWLDNESSLNGSQAPLDRDGVLRIVISAKDPGVANWLDTAGYPRGVIQGRWTACTDQPIPSVRKVALANVRSALPAGTPMVSPAERERLIRARRAAYQQRPLW